MFRDLERVDGPFVGIAAHRDRGRQPLDRRQHRAAEGMLVSGSYFPLLGLRPFAGRLLDAERRSRRRRGERRRVELRLLAVGVRRGIPSVVGRTLVVNGKPLTIVGVGPRGFHGTTVGARPQVFVPITFRWLGGESAFPDHADRKSYWAYLFARLKPGVSLEQAAAAINVPYRAILNEVDAPLLTDFREQDDRTSFAPRRSCSRPASAGRAESTTTRATR